MAIATALVNVTFYGLVYIAEVGYLAAVAALACLVPATWPRPAPRLLVVRGVAALLACMGVMLLAPGNVPLYGTDHHAWMPNLAHAIEVEGMEAAYNNVICGATGGKPAFVVTDNPGTTHTRALTFACPHVTVGLFLFHHRLQSRWDNWIIFERRAMWVLPPPVPLEPGPPARGSLRASVARIIVAPDATPRLRQAMQRISLCSPRRKVLPRPDRTVDEKPIETLIFPARCLPWIRLGQNELRIPAAGS